MFRIILSIKDIAHYVQPASPRQKVNCHNYILTYPRLRRCAPCLGLCRVSLSEAVNKSEHLADTFNAIRQDIYLFLRVVEGEGGADSTEDT